MADVQILQDIRFTRLQERAKKYLKYDRIGKILYYLAFVWALSDVVIAAQYTTGILFLVLEIAGVLVPIIPWILVARKRRRSNLEDDEWVRFYSGSIVVDLEEYAKSKNPDKKEENKKNALKSALRLLSIVEDWNIGGFLPVKLYVGESVNIFKKNLRTRIIPVLRDSNDDKELENVNQIMYQLYAISRGTFNIEAIQNMNTKIFERIPNEKTFKIGPFAKTSSFFRTHRVLQHCFIVSGLVMICIFVGYEALNYGMSRDTVFLGSIALFGILLGAYVARDKLPK